jgi:hypothetical protein
MTTSPAAIWLTMAPLSFLILDTGTLYGVEQCGQSQLVDSGAKFSIAGKLELFEENLLMWI